MSLADPTIAHEMEAAFAWWRDAGVDYAFEDDATAWLSDGLDRHSNADAETGSKDPQRAISDAGSDKLEPIKKPAETLDPFDGDSPTTLDSFRDWWLQAPGLDAIGPRGRIPPRGTSKAELLVLVMDPEQADSDRLLSGPQGAFLNRFLSAAGIAQENVYFASALPRHTPMADPVACVSAGLGTVLLRHLTLADPKRILALGGNILPLLGTELPQTGKNLREINPSAPNTPLLTSEGLDSLMASPRLKARFWRRWIEWRAEH